jgi:hypothetical protein
MATYIDAPDIDGLMDDLQAQRPEELVGKEVFAYVRGSRLLALSALPPYMRPKAQLRARDCASLVEEIRKGMRDGF